MAEQDIDAICRVIEGDAEFAVDLDMWNLDIYLRKVCGNQSGNLADMGGGGLERADTRKGDESPLSFLATWGGCPRRLRGGSGYGPTGRASYPKSSFSSR